MYVPYEIMLDHWGWFNEKEFFCYWNIPVFGKFCSFSYLVWIKFNVKLKLAMEM